MNPRRLHRETIFSINTFSFGSAINRARSVRDGDFDVKDGTPYPAAPAKLTPRRNVFLRDRPHPGPLPQGEGVSHRTALSHSHRSSRTTTCRARRGAGHEP